MLDVWCCNVEMRNIEGTDIDWEFSSAQETAGIKKSCCHPSLTVSYGGMRMLKGSHSNWPEAGELSISITLEKAGIDKDSTGQLPLCRLCRIEHRRGHRQRNGTHLVELGGHLGLNDFCCQSLDESIQASRPSHDARFSKCAVTVLIPGLCPWT